MSTLTPTTHRASPPRRLPSLYHHMHVYKRTDHCWMWDCPCGGGVHDTTHALATQPAAFVAALNHANRNPGG